MSYYYEHLFESEVKPTPSRFTILFEGYNPQAVMANANKFMDYAEADGFEIPETSMKTANQEKRQLYSVYFDCTRDNESWKIRVSDHQHNNNYDNDTNFQIIADTELSDEEMSKRYANFMKGVMHDIKDKDMVIFTLKTSDLAQKFVLNYRTTPGWINQFLQGYSINPAFKNFTWFKQLLQQKCEELAEKSPRFNQMYRETAISTWKKGQPLSHF